MLFTDRSIGSQSKETNWRAQESVTRCFPCSVLSGPRTAVKLAQMASESPVDGIMGPNTLKAINGMDEQLFEATYALLRINRYREICNRDRSQGKFLKGWLNRVFNELDGVVS